MNARNIAVMAVVALGLSLSACDHETDGNGRDRGSERRLCEAVTPGKCDHIDSDRAEVPWADYFADVKQRIDQATRQGKCKALQHEFDIADANSDATMERTGHSNANLMSYIDEALREAGCY
jgi:hypothetical protein